MNEYRRMKLPIRKVVNRILFGLMLAERINTAELADMVGVSRSTVSKWIYNGNIPRKKETITLVCEILDAPSYVLFNEVDIDKRRNIHEIE